MPGGGHGSPLQSSCLESPVHRGAWLLMVHRVAKGQIWTWLKQLSMHACILVLLITAQNEKKTDMSIKRKISHKVQFIQWYSTLQNKDNERVTHTTAWMRPETFEWQTENSMSPFIFNNRWNEPIVREIRIEFAYKQIDWKWCKRTFWSNENVLYLK